VSTILATNLDFELPWVSSTEEQSRFRSILGVIFSLILLLGIGIPFINLPEIQRAELEQLPPQLARFVMEPLKIVVPPVPERTVAKTQDVKPEPIPEKIEAYESPPKLVKPQPSVADAREKAQISGLLAFQDAFADMRDAVDVSKLRDTASIQRGTGEAAKLDRSIISSKQTSRSAGVEISALSRATGGVALSGRSTTRVEVVEGSGGNGGNRSQQALDQRARSIEDIRRVFDANKGAIFAIYNRALRSDPGLQGQLVLELVIDSNGVVVSCSVQSSELEDERLVAKLVSRISMFDFGKKDVRATRINYPVHFLPG